MMMKNEITNGQHWLGLGKGGKSGAWRGGDVGVAVC